jgi:phosphatidylglycerol:prolipoprotein diacylglycerol transferase
VTLGDVIAPSFLLGVGIHRLGGCFLAGCCFGRPTGSILGVVFPPEGHLAPFPFGTPLWPTQLFASVLGFAGFGLLYCLEQRDSFSRHTFWLVFAYYSIDRIIVDQFRYYEPSQILGTLGPLTLNINHIFLSGIFITCVVFWVRLKKF